MATLYIDHAGLDLRPEKGALVIYQDGRRIRTVPFALLERVVIQSETSIPSKLLCALAEAGIGLAILGRRPERAVFMLGRPHADARIRLAQARQFYELWREPYPRPQDACNQPVLAARMAMRFIAAKLSACRRTLEIIRRLRGDSAPGYALQAGLESLASLQEKLMRLPACSAATLLGIEGAAASAYYPALSACFAPGLNFCGRNRRPPRDPVNAVLSLAYTLLHFDAVRAAHAAGLDAQIGFFHTPAYGRESLASDLIEPLRPRADFWVWKLFRDGQLRKEHFTGEAQGIYLGKTGRQRFYESYEAAVPLWRRWLRRAAYGLVAALKTQALPRIAGRWEGEWECEL